MPSRNMILAEVESCLRRLEWLAPRPRRDHGKSRKINKFGGFTFVSIVFFFRLVAYGATSGERPMTADL